MARSHERRCTVQGFIKYLHTSLSRMCRVPASLCLSTSLPAEWGAGEMPQAHLESYTRTEVSFTPAPTAGPAPLLLIPLTAQNFAVPHLRQFSLCITTHSKPENLAGGGSITARASIDMAQKKGQQLRWDKNKPTPTHMRREEKNKSSITTYRLSFQMSNPVTKCMNQNRYLGEKSQPFLLFAKSQQKSSKNLSSVCGLFLVIIIICFLRFSYRKSYKL